MNPAEDSKNPEIAARLLPNLSANNPSIGIARSCEREVALRRIPMSTVDMLICSEAYSGRKDLTKETPMKEETAERKRKPAERERRIVLTPLKTRCAFGPMGFLRLGDMSRITGTKSKERTDEA